VIRAEDSAPIAAIGAHTFFGSLAQEQREELERVGLKRDFPRGATLMFQHEREDRVMILLSGRVKVSRVDHDGREVLLSIRDPGDVLGELALIDGQPRIATVTALEGVAALVLGAEALRAYLETAPKVAVALLEVIARRFRDTTLKRSQFGASDTMGRLAARVLELAERYGEPSDAGVTVICPLSRSELVAWTGASRAGVGQALQALQALGWLHASGRTLLVRDIESLRARAAEGSQR
jgi:CRP/FNR family transcriptional regulator, cyclic AMP receptor protein